MNTRTKKMLIAAVILTALSAMLSIGPLIVYAVKSFTENSATTGEKCILMSMICVGVILSLICVINKYTPRCRIWLILIGFYVCLDNIIGCILIIACTQILDELVVHPLARSFRAKYTINKEMDKRA